MVMRDVTVFRGEGRWGYIDNSGKVVIAQQYDDARDFSEGLARVNISGKWGYIDRYGDIFIEATFVDSLDIGGDI
ncbi:MAG: WG repeat-containing protein [Planctomycetota bacterium]|jgi:hypothetical protein